METSWDHLLENPIFCNIIYPQCEEKTLQSSDTVSLQTKIKQNSKLKIYSCIKGG